MSSKIRLRHTTKTEIGNALGKALSDTFKRSDMFASCITCMSFDDKKELCNKATPPQRPPAEVLVNSCDAYEDDGEIPF